MSQSHRISNEGLLNRNKEISFKFNGKKYYGFKELGKEKRSRW